MKDGKGDVTGRTVFGTDTYAAKESSRLSNGGTQKRTFVYGDDAILMEKHLKIGTADNATDTLRIHFEWLANEERLVIGHCGRHLDF